MDDPQEEEEEEEPEDDEEAEEPEEGQADEEANEVDEEAVDPEGDDDQELDGAENKDMEEGENENDEDPSLDSGAADADGDEHEESDLQPAHRSEALDVLTRLSYICFLWQPVLILLISNRIHQYRVFFHKRVNLGLNTLSQVAHSFASTECLLPSHHTVSAPFTQEECQELMTLIRSFDGIHF